jgi:futalosine hydrolase
MTSRTYDHILLAAATDFELEPARIRLGGIENVSFLVCGVGPVETAFNLTRFLSVGKQFDAVINFGVAGAYHESGQALLDLCLATKEVLADFGVCLGDRIIPLAENIPVMTEFDLQNDLFLQARNILAKSEHKLHCGTFLTVNCASGTRSRGDHLQKTYQALSENMEGGAVARVCKELGLPLLELRCISNMVEDRNPSKWRLAEACEIAGEGVAHLVTGLKSNYAQSLVLSP